METAGQPRKQSRAYGIIALIAWTAAIFMLGVYVGIHPTWIPNMSWAYHPDLSPPPTNITPLPPTTQPAEQNAMQSPETQPSEAPPAQAQPPH